MGAAAIITAVSALLSVAFNLYQMARQIQGTEPVPEWDEISSKNALLQAQIDAEK